MNTRQAIQYLSEQLPQAVLAETEYLEEFTLKLRKESLVQGLTILKQMPEPGFEVLMDLTGVDYLQPTKRTKVVYWLHNPTNLQRIRIVIFAARGEAMPSVTPLWRGADWYERELFDLFGVHFRDHPDMKRILMPDGWLGHPLRKDYSLTEEPVQFKHGVKPKVPSEIIPYAKSERR